MKVLITASRDWENREKVWYELDLLLAQGQGVEVIHGDCPTGGDRHARLWCELRQQSHPNEVREHRFPALWEQYGKRAGFIRNQVMVEEEPDVCLAFVRPCRRCPRRDVHGSHGATDTIVRCIEADVPVREFREA